MCTNGSVHKCGQESVHQKKCTNGSVHKCGQDAGTRKFAHGTAHQCGQQVCTRKHAQRTACTEPCTNVATKCAQALVTSPPFCDAPHPTSSPPYCEVCTPVWHGWCGICVHPLCGMCAPLYGMCAPLSSLCAPLCTPEWHAKADSLSLLDPCVAGGGWFHLSRWSVDPFSGLVSHLFKHTLPKHGRARALSPKHRLPACGRTRANSHPPTVSCTIEF